MSRSDRSSKDVRTKNPTPNDLAGPDVKSPALRESSPALTGKREDALSKRTKRKEVSVRKDSVDNGKPKEPDGTPIQVSVVTPERTLWYVERLFAYTNQLLERTQARCNYLIFANSVAAAAAFTIMNLLLANRGQFDYLVSKQNALLLMMLPTSAFLSSLVLAVLAFLPKIYDYEIELNQVFITRMSPDKYREFIDAKTDESKLADFIDEIHVLSRIINSNNKLVKASARLFLISILTVPLVVTLILIRN